MTAVQEKTLTQVARGRGRGRPIPDRDRQNRRVPGHGVRSPGQGRPGAEEEALMIIPTRELAVQMKRRPGS